MSHLYLPVGPPGSGKRTIGKVLSALVGAVLLDNLDGVKEIPKVAGRLVGWVRAATREAVMLAPPDVSHIFTQYLPDWESEWNAVNQLRALAAKRGASENA